MVNELLDVVPTKVRLERRTARIYMSPSPGLEKRGHLHPYSDKDVNKHLWLIYLTPVLSNVGKDIVIEGYVKPAVLERVDDRQYGTVPKSFT